MIKKYTKVQIRENEKWKCSERFREVLHTHKGCDYMESNWTGKCMEVIFDLIMVTKDAKSIFFRFFKLFVSHVSSFGKQLKSLHSCV